MASAGVGVGSGDAWRPMGSPIRRLVHRGRGRLPSVGDVLVSVQGDGNSAVDCESTFKACDAVGLTVHMRVGSFCMCFEPPDEGGTTPDPPTTESDGLTCEEVCAACKSILYPGDQRCKECGCAS